MSKGIFIVFLALILNSCTQAQTKKEQTKLSATEFSDKISTTKNAVILDVRTPAEFEKGHLENAMNIDWNGPDFDTQISKLDKTKPVLIYCLSGSRSYSAAEKMRNEGFKTVIEMPGGLMEWRASNLPETMMNKPTGGMSIAQYEALLKTDKLVLIDFYADWCVPCKKMEPYLQKIATEMPEKVKVIRIDADENAELCQKLNVNALPFLKLYKANKLIWENQGFIEEKGVREQLK